MWPIRNTAAAAALAIVALGGTAAGQCTTVDFEDYDEGDILLSIPGVSFSAVGGNGDPKPIVVDPFAGTSSGNLALSVQTGLPDFSPQLLRMVFTDTQRIVTFTMGEPVSDDIDFRVIAYTAAGGVVYARTFGCGAGVYHFVRVGSESGPKIIKRIEIEAIGSWYEGVDDLSFNFDPTPPVVELEEPDYLDCICDSVQIRGIACDDDGEYDNDRFEYRRVGAAPGTDWTYVHSVSAPACDPDTILYTWNTATVPHGTYYLRVTATNKCGLSTSDIVTVIVDKNPPTIDVEEPAMGATVCGEVDITGKVTEACGACFESYRVSYARSGMPFTTLLISDEVVINGTIATWDTSALPDGPYILRIEAVDVCGQLSEQLIPLTLDQGLCGCVGDLDEDGEVGFTDLLAVLAGWGPCP